MEGILATLVGAIPGSTTTVLSFVAFLAVTTVALILLLNRMRLAGIQESLKDLPEKDRRRILEAKIGAPLPPGMKASEWLRYQQQKYYFIAFLALLGFVVVMFAIYRFDAKPSLDPAEESERRKAEETRAAEAAAAAARLAAEKVSAADKAAAEQTARRALDLIYRRDKDNELFNMWLDSIKQNYGSLAAFRKFINQQRVQLVEAPVQRSVVALDVSGTQAAGTFLAETDGEMEWRETINLYKVGDQWKLNAFGVNPVGWNKVNAAPAAATLAQFASNSSASNPNVGAIMPPGWLVEVVSPPRRAEDPHRCDVDVAAGGSTAIMHSLYGSCGLAQGTRIYVLGVASSDGVTTSIEQVRFAPDLAN